jgi:hypothetical protein
MAPNPKVVAAYRAMSGLGVSEVKVKSVLKKLLKLYDKNWALIEEENYRALADAIFEDDDNMVCFCLYSPPHSLWFLQYTYFHGWI